jgi:hypothetical protein
VVWIFDRDSMWTTGAFFLAGLYAFRVANWLFRVLVGSAMYYITKERRVDAVVAMFYQHKLPLTEGLAVDTDDLQAEFAVLARKPGISEDLRHFLYMTVAEITWLRMEGRLFALFQASSVLDAAVRRYRNEVNARGAPAGQPTMATS